MPVSSEPSFLVVTAIDHEHGILTVEGGAALGIDPGDYTFAVGQPLKFESGPRYNAIVKFE